MNLVYVLIAAFYGAALLVNCGLEVDACSCQPTHPQDLYCMSDFVIKVRVKRARMVELQPDGTFKVEKAKSEKEKGEEKKQSDGLERIEGSGKIGAEKPEPHHGLQNVGPLGPQLRTPGHNPGPSRVHFRHDGASPPGPSVSNDKSMEKRSSVQIPPVLYHSSGVGGPPGAHGNPITSRSRLMMQYKVHIAKVYKGLQNVSEEQLKFLYTPPVPLCNAKLPTDKSPIVLMGDVHDGVLLVRQCDYRVGLSKLSQEQRKNVIRNVERRYPAHCKQCKVEVCNLGACEGERQPSQCRWKEWWSTHSPYSSQFICVLGKSNKCKWYNPLSKEIRPEDIDEWTR